MKQRRIDYFALDPDGKQHTLKGEPGEDVTLDNLKGVAPLPDGWIHVHGDLMPKWVLVSGEGGEAGIVDRRPWAPMTIRDPTGEPYYTSELPQGWSVFRTEDHRELAEKLSYADAVVLCERLRLRRDEFRAGLIEWAAVDASATFDWKD